MKLSISEQTNGRTSLQLTTTNQSEALPFPRQLLFDARLVNRPPDRLWISAALTFGHKLRNTFINTAPPSDIVLREINQFLGISSGIGTAPVAHKPSIDLGGNAFVLSYENKWAKSSGQETGRDIYLDLLPTSTWVGSLFSINRIQLATNASAATVRFDPTQVTLNHLAIAVLLAADFHVGEIVIPFSNANDSSVLNAASKLCAVSGLRIVPQISSSAREGGLG